MLVNRKVKIDDPGRLKEFYHGYKIISTYPVFEGNYIYVSDRGDKLDMGNIIYIVKYGEDVDLNDPKNIIQFINTKKNLSKREEEYLLEETDVNQLWKKVKMIYHFGLIEKEEETKTVYNLFCSLIKTDKEIIEAFFKVDINKDVLFSSLITMLLRAQSYKEYQGTVNSRYLDQLRKTNQVIKNVKSKAISYLSSEKNDLDMLVFLLSLKRG